MSLIMTKAALALKHADNNFQFVKFEAHKPKKKTASTEDSDGINTKLEKQKFSKKDLELKQIRHEVVKFGMSGFDGSKKEEAKIALAVSLGAKPPKKPYINYKELMQKRKEAKEQESIEKQLFVSKSILKSTGKKKQKGVNKKNDVGHFLDNFGKVNKKDLKKTEDAKKKAPRKKKKIKIAG